MNHVYCNCYNNIFALFSVMFNFLFNVISISLFPAFLKVYINLLNVYMFVYNFYNIPSRNNSLYDNLFFSIS